MLYALKKVNGTRVAFFTVMYNTPKEGQRIYWAKHHINKSGISKNTKEFNYLHD